MKIEILEIASKEFISAKEFYELEQSGLGFCYYHPRLCPSAQKA